MTTTHRTIRHPHFRASLIRLGSGPWRATSIQYRSTSGRWEPLPPYRMSDTTLDALQERLKDLAPQALRERQAERQQDAERRAAVEDEQREADRRRTRFHDWVRRRFDHMLGAYRDERPERYHYVDDREIVEPVPFPIWVAQTLHRTDSHDALDEYRAKRREIVEQA